MLDVDLALDLEQNIETMKQKLEKLTRELLVSNQNLKIKELKIQEQDKKINEKETLIKAQAETIETIKTENKMLEETNETLEESNEKLREMNDLLIDRIANEQLSTSEPSKYPPQRQRTIHQDKRDMDNVRTPNRSSLCGYTSTWQDGNTNVCTEKTIMHGTKHTH